MIRKNLKFIIPVIFIVGGVAYLMASGVSQTGVYYRTVPEILAEPAVYSGESIRISGHVVPGSIDYNQQELRLNFAVSEKDQPAEFINVSYKGVAPDAFTDEAEVIIEGQFTMEGNSFEASMLLAKCPSKYVAEDEEEN
jgi:cytochrome c-type biogenesis protein CcmE